VQTSRDPDGCGPSLTSCVLLFPLRRSTIECLSRNSSIPQLPLESKSGTERRRIPQGRKDVSGPWFDVCARVGWRLRSRQLGEKMMQRAVTSFESPMRMTAPSPMKNESFQGVEMHHMWEPFPSLMYPCRKKQTSGADNTSRNARHLPRRGSRTNDEAGVGPGMHAGLVVRQSHSLSSVGYCCSKQAGSQGIAPRACLVRPFVLRLRLTLTLPFCGLQFAGSGGEHRDGPGLRVQL